MGARDAQAASADGRHAAEAADSARAARVMAERREMTCANWITRHARCTALLESPASRSLHAAHLQSEHHAMAIYRLADHTPQLHASVWVAPGASVIGQVTMGQDCSVWYGSVLRGDNDRITMGQRCNVQDACVLHADPGFALTLGDDVSVGHQVMLHGCTVGDGSLIGIQSIVMNGAKIGKSCLVGAGSLVTEGKEFPDGSMIIGRPAKVLRALTADEIARLRVVAAHYAELALHHRTQTELVG